MQKGYKRLVRDAATMLDYNAGGILYFNSYCVIADSEALIRRLTNTKRLEGHQGCVSDHLLVKLFQCHMQ